MQSDCLLLSSYYSLLLLLYRAGRPFSSLSWYFHLSLFLVNTTSSDLPLANPVCS